MKKEKKSRKNDKHKVGKWDKIEIRLGWRIRGKRQQCLWTFKASRIELTKNTCIFWPLLKSFGFMFAINQKTTTAAKLKETRERGRSTRKREEEGKLETKVERVFRRVYNPPEAYDAARNFNYGQLNGQNFGTVSCQIYQCQLPAVPPPLPSSFALKSNLNSESSTTIYLLTTRTLFKAWQS